MDHCARLPERDLVGADRTKILKFASGLISETTSLVASAKFLGQAERERFLELSLSAMQLYKRCQRNPRIPRNTPLLVYRETDPTMNRELANTVNISKKGACISTSRVWESGEKIWIQKAGNQEQCVGRVAWVEKSEPSRFLMGIEILNCEDFWGLDLVPPSTRD